MCQYSMSQMYKKIWYSNNLYYQVDFQCHNLLPQHRNFEIFFVSEYNLADIASSQLLSSSQLSTQGCQTRKYFNYKGKITLAIF